MGSARARSVEPSSSWASSDVKFFTNSVKCGMESALVNTT